MGVTGCSCASKVEASWPLAYADCSGSVLVDLQSHLVRTAEKVRRLFEGEAEVLENSVKRACALQVKLIEVAHTAALLHDIGKASLYYLEHFRRTYAQQAKLSFRLHEHATAALVEHAARLSEDEAFKEAARLVSRVVARHHSAMKGRGPSEIGTGDVRLICDVLSKLTIDSGWASRLGRYCIGDFCRKLVSMIPSVAESLSRNARSISISMYTRSLLLDEASPAAGRCKILQYKRVVIALSGFLVVADCIAASEEGRGTDEEVGSLFVHDWLRELKYKLPGSTI